MKIAISQSNYIPWIGYFKLINQADKFIFYDQVQYTKNDWRNRNRIVVNRKVEWLTIPVEYKFSNRTSIENIHLPNTNWSELHLAKLKTAYHLTPHFGDYYGHLEKSLRSNHSLLSQLNQELVRTISGILGIQTSIHHDYVFDLSMNPNERLIAACIDNQADEYVTTPKALNYLDCELFRKRGINVTFIDFESCLSFYKQDLENFDPYVSVLDLLFQLGSASARVRI